MLNVDICEEIQDRILCLKYAPGQFLNEQDLAREFGVSRTPIRKALMRLEWEKLVKIVPRGGAMVSMLDFKQLMEIYHLRINIEGTIGRIAATRISQNELDGMEGLIEVCRTIEEEESVEKLVRVDLSFHKMLYASVKNDLLASAASYLYHNTARLWYAYFEKSSFPGLVEDQLKEIEEAVDVFTRRDPQAAEQCRRSVVVDAINKLSRTLLQQVELEEASLGPLPPADREESQIP